MREEAGGGGGAPWGSEGQSAPPLGDPHMALSQGGSARSLKQRLFWVAA